MNSGSNELVAELFRNESARLIAQLTARFGAQRLEAIEDAVQDALLAAMRAWPIAGTPQSPRAWLQRAAHNALIDRWRRQRRETNYAVEELTQLADAVLPTVGEARDGLSEDDLALLFLCCAPSLPLPSQVALTLKLACGLGTREIARALLESESNIAQRIVRAKSALREAALPTLPGKLTELRERTATVAQVVYLLFDIGYFNEAAEAWLQPALCRDALRMARVLADHEATASPETLALSALLCFAAARLPARGVATAAPIPLGQQQRERWDRQLVNEGFWRFDRSIGGPNLSRYHIEAAIAACHARAPSFAATDWQEILTHYDRLCRDFPSPIATLNRIVALAKVRGHSQALQSLETAQNLTPLENSVAYQATMGRLQEELGRGDEAAARYRQAAQYAGNTALGNYFAAEASRVSSS